MHSYAGWMSRKIVMTFANMLHFLSPSYLPFGKGGRSVLFRGLIEGDLTVVISNFASSDFRKSKPSVKTRKSLKIHFTKDIDLRI